MEKYLQDLKTICKINSYTKNKIGVDKVGIKMQEWLEDIGFQTITYTRKKLGNHQVFTSTKTSGDKILFVGHNDTVFPPDIFETFTQDNDWVYGAGVCDMKGGNIVALQSLRNIYFKNNSINNIDFLLVSDEETGSDDSKALTLELAKNYKYCFVYEAAGKNLEVVTSRKGVGTYTISIEGKASHAGTSYIDGIDANLEASYKLQELIKLTNLELGTTVNVGKIDGGIGANTISSKCEILFEIRYKTTSEKNRLLNALDTIAKTSYVYGTKSTLNGLIQRDVMEETQEQLDFIQKLQIITNQKILKEQRGGVSDANHVSSCGVITLDGFGPFGDGDHTINERALKSSFKQRISMMTKILEYHQNNNCNF
jgi:glutamate carboxypeptidase